MKRRDSLAGGAETLNAFVETAIEGKVQRDNQDALYEAYAFAAKDPTSRADTNAVAVDFETTDRDGL